MENYLTTDVFLITHNGLHILYAPLLRLVIQVNGKVVNLIKQIQDGNELISLSPNELNIIHHLQNLGLITSDKNNKLPVPKKDIIGFQPTSVTIFPTFECNLKCIYCYSSGGENIISMPPEMAKSSIDFILLNALTLKKRKAKLSFHGGGEPTINWDFFTEIIRYGQEQAKINNIDLSVSMGSNCILNSHQVSWIINNLRSITVSLDGPPYIQDKQRPLKNGGPSYEIVSRVLKKFDVQGFKYAIRSTITENSVNFLDDIVSHFCREYKPQSIHLEPLSECGRCKTSGETAPNHNIFFRQFLPALDIAKSANIFLYYSGARIDALSNSFCGASKDHFVVLPDGNVTACNEVCRSDDPRVNDFYYGRYISRDAGFEFNQNKIGILQSRVVQNIPFCSKCFLKWHCSGDCPSKVSLTSGSPFKPSWSRCELNHNIASEYLVRLLKNENDFTSFNIRKISID